MNYQIKNISVLILLLFNINLYNYADENNNLFKLIKSYKQILFRL